MIEYSYKKKWSDIKIINNIIANIKKDEKFSFEKVIENNIMTDDEYFEFLKY